MPGRLTIDLLTPRRMRRIRQPTPPEIWLLTRLAAELSRSGVRTQPTPDMTALLAYRANALLAVWVFVGGACFCWDFGSQHHPVTDISGAAHALASYLGGEAS